MYKIGICDDGKNICAALEDMLFCYAKKKNIEIEVNVWYSGEELKEYLTRGYCLDILYLDIELFRVTGIEVGDYIRNQLDNVGIQIVYISGKVSYAQRLFKTQPLDFLVKPISQCDINNVMEMGVKILKKKKERFEFQQGKDYYYLPIGDIMYLESRGRKIKVVTAKRTYEFYGKLKETIRVLSEDFIVIHKSYVVNKEYIFRYTYERVELMNGTIIPISTINRKSVREKILRDE